MPKSYEYLWPEGGLTRAHYDAYIAVVAAMGIVRLPNIYHYWTTNGARFLVPFVRTTLSSVKGYVHDDSALPPLCGCAQEGATRRSLDARTARL